MAFETPGSPVLASPSAEQPPATEPPPEQRSQSKRILGIDLARGFALIGMFTAHFGLSTSVEFSDPSTWGGLVNGRSSILFAILAGVSLAIITGRTAPFKEKKLADARAKILVRALCIFVLGTILTALNSYIAIILQTYAALFIIALVCLRLRRRWLVAIALAWTVGGPLLAAVWEPLVEPLGLGVPMAELLIWGSYPVLTWVPYILIGLAIGRTDLMVRKNQVLLVVIGAIFAVLGYTAAAQFSTQAPFEDESLEQGDFDMPSIGESISANLSGWSTAEPHSNTPFEILGSGGFAVAFLGLCLLLTPLTRLIFAPVIAMGAMSLTVYTLHVISYRLVQDDSFMNQGLAVWPWLLTIIGTAVFAVIWQKAKGKGPLERLVNRIVVATVGFRTNN